mmetsp:Transcript_13976/g.25622  ORF Transcript_13976/g.25622 Transcript_13976/m.25622 type:complete len:313 (+) Transcript_13976:233-1171(+)
MLLTFSLLYVAFLSTRLLLLPSLPDATTVLAMIYSTLKRTLVTSAFWVSTLAVPLVLTTTELGSQFLQNIDTSPTSNHGLYLGLGTVTFSQFVVILYHSLNLSQKSPKYIQQSTHEPYSFLSAVLKHLTNLEGFVLLTTYLSLYWTSQKMPTSYYTYSPSIPWPSVFLSLLTTDFLQYLLHRFEHVLPSIYKKTHKPHHVYKSPNLFNAFSGSTGDTVLMILVPLFLTSRLIDMNVWGYMCFGSLYSTFLTVIHSEVEHCWDEVFKAWGFGTPEMHHYHHRFFDGNYGHLFMYWDWIGKTAPRNRNMSRKLK